MRKDYQNNMMNTGHQFVFSTGDNIPVGSINGKLDAMWDLTGMNIIPTLTSNFDLINNIDDYVIGQFVILKIIGEDEKIFIKSGEKSWHNLIVGNASPFYTKFKFITLFK